jgi:hypothetical protein
MDIADASALDAAKHFKATTAYRLVRRPASGEHTVTPCHQALGQKLPECPEANNPAGQQAMLLGNAI